MPANNGRTQRIREYLVGRPGSRSLAIARALGESTREVNHDLRRMEAQHVVIANHTLGYGKSEFTLNPVPVQALRRGPVTRAPKPQPESVPAQSVDDYIARGGHVEKLPSHWEAPRMAHVGFTFGVQFLGRSHG